MDTTRWRVVGTGVLFLVIFISGFWLSRAGKPYNVILSTVHKLIGLAAGVFLVVIIFQVNRTAGLSTTEWIVSVVTGLLFLVNGVSGGLVMTGNPMPAILSTIHRIVPYLIVLSTAATLYFLVGP
jgi:succinate dehydrogenase/fumarate reductase cytochrome b subunit